MGKGFQNFMSKKDFHPSAIWNLKKVWEAREKQSLEKKRQEEMRAQYDKEQEMLENKALLGDEKAKLGLSFMYDAPAGISRREEEKPPELEPKFEWQRKFNAPREEWAKGNEDIKDQPFGIAVRNVRCVKCHTWGHLNTDNECPLYNMSGNYDEAGYSTNPSDLIRANRKAKAERRPGPSAVPRGTDSDEKTEKIRPDELVSDMKEEYGLTLKKHVMDGIKADEAVEKIGRRRTTSTSSGDEKQDQQQLMFEFLKTLSEKERAKIFNDFFSGKKRKKDKKEKKEKKHKTDTSKKIKKEKKEKKGDKNDIAKRDYSFDRRHIKKEPQSPISMRRSIKREHSRSPPSKRVRTDHPRPDSEHERRNQRRNRSVSRERGKRNNRNSRSCSRDRHERR